MNVAVCVCTYNRPTELELLLVRLSELRAGWPSFDLIVVDNSPDGNARERVERWPARYVRTTQRGIAVARNQAVAEASGYDVLVFMDDDEQPSDDWLPALLSPLIDPTVHAVGGPVKSFASTPLEQRLLDHGLIQRPTRARGITRDLLATNNVAIRTSALRVLGSAPFDLRFNLTGGEDSDLFDRLRLRGCNFYWEPAAEVQETLGARATWRWISKRGIQDGVVQARLADSHGRASYLIVAGGLMRCLVAGPKVLLALLGRRPFGPAARSGLRGAGMIVGAFGMRSDTY